MKKEFEIIKKEECNFLFYKKTGIWGMYSKQTRVYSFCIPYFFGFSYTISWGLDL